MLGDLVLVGLAWAVLAVLVALLRVVLRALGVLPTDTAAALLYCAQRIGGAFCVYACMVAMFYIIARFMPSLHAAL